MRKLLSFAWLVGSLALIVASLYAGSPTQSPVAGAHPLPATCVMQSACGSQTPEVNPHLRQVAPVFNPASGRIRLYGLTEDGRVLQFEQRTGNWFSVNNQNIRFESISAASNPQTDEIHLFGVTDRGHPLQFNLHMLQWEELDQSDAGFLN